MATAPQSTRLRNPSLSVYVHIPWCARKCPYCDFNSHQANDDLPVEDYIRALYEDLAQDQWMSQGRTVHSIFIGGGTPSLLPNAAIGRIVDIIDKTLGIETGAEITMEANPGTLEHHNFHELRATGVNRLSLGVQSFHSNHLQALGRIHSVTEATEAIRRAQDGGFEQLNIDLMHGLPNQTPDEAEADLLQAIQLEPSHISWYQLTIEQNTEFFSRPPTLPHEDTLIDIFEMGQKLLAENVFEQYEVSAYAKNNNASKHNLNYWTFGDYMAIGAGAHGKITVEEQNRIFRYRKTRLPRDYLDNTKQYTAHTEDIAEENRTLEFMMNALRLNQGFTQQLFESNTGCDWAVAQKSIKTLVNKGLLEKIEENVRPTRLGRQFLNNLLEGFIDNGR